MNFQTFIREEIAKEINALPADLDYSGVEIEIDSSSLYEGELMLQVIGFVIDKTNEKRYVYHRFDTLQAEVEAALTSFVRGE